MNRQRATLWRVFKLPVAIALLTAAGLISALLGDGLWDVPGWIGLGVPALLAFYRLLGR